MSRPLVPFFLVLLLSTALPVRAQEVDNGEDGPALVTRDAVRAEIARISDDPDLDEDVRDRALETYSEVMQALDVRDGFREQAVEFTTLMDTAPTRIQDIRTRIAEHTPQPVPQLDPEEVSEIALQRAVAEARMRRDSAQAQITVLAAEDARRAERRQEITQLLIEARAAFEQAAAQAGQGAAAAHPAVNEAQRLLNQARMELRQAEIEALEREYLSYDVRSELLVNRQREAQLTAEDRERVLRVWQERLTNFRREESERVARAAREAALEATRAVPAIQEFAAESVSRNAELVERRTGPEGVLALIERAQRRIEQTVARTEQVRADFAILQERVDTAGRTGALAPLFQNYRETLPELSALDRGIRQRERRAAEIQIDRLNTRQDLAALGDPATAAAALVADLDPSVSEAELVRVRGILEDQLEARRRTKTALLTDYDEYLQVLANLEAAEQELRGAVAEFRSYIDQRALWMLSTAPIRLEDGRHVLAGLAEHFTLEASTELIQFVWEDLQAYWYWYALALAPLAFVTLGHLRLRRWYKAVLEEGAKRNTITMRPTFTALWLIFLRKFPAPFLLGAVGWRLTLALEAPLAIRAVGEGAIALAAFVFSITFLYELCRGSGVSPEHLGWPKTACERMRRHLRWYTPIAAPAVAVVGFASAFEAAAWTQSLGRLALVTLLIATMVAAAIVLRPKQGAMSLIFRMNESQGGLRAMSLVYVITQVLLLALVAATLLGFHDTAVRFAHNLYWSFVFVMGGYLTFSVGARWLLVAKRKLAMEKLRERAKEADEETVAEMREELVRIDEQTRALWRSACWITFLVLVGGLWLNEVPALQGLRQVELWTVTDTYVETVLGADGVEETISRETAVPITLLEIVAAIAVVVIGLTVVRNAPGFLETAVLRHLSIGSGERYAFNTLVQYVLTVIVVIWAFGNLGIGWSKVQWLVAALSVGLGFGLQEIFANFVSGLIVLFERPVRVGDVITVNGQSGTVTKIRIRATSIRDFDRKELIIPNKDLVTGQLLNWTLSDSVQRLVIPVGIAYGSDVELAESVLMEAVRKDRRVMDDPPPVVLYTGFGDNALDFEVRAFTSDIADAVPLRHDLHKAIDKALREAGIEIAFPQRDLHFRGPLEIVHQGEPVETYGDSRPGEA